MTGSHRPFGIVLAAGALWAAGPVAGRTPYPADPLGSPMWTAQAISIFGDDPVRFDSRVTITYPQIAENQRSFPVALDARGVGRPVRRMVIFADLNPIPIAIDYRTPVRGAVQLADGQWLVAGGWVDAAGGGCSAPPVSRVKGDWAEHLGEMRGEAWPMIGHAARLRVTFRHPMDTGLVANIPTYHLEDVTVKTADGAELATMAVWASVAEDPAITMMPHAAAGDMVRVEARDTNGRNYLARVMVKLQSPVPTPVSR